MEDNLVKEYERLQEEYITLLRDAFNEQRDCVKWDYWRKMENVSWHCSNCGEEMDKPQRCPPFRGTSSHCSYCDAMLTRRTGGGQYDPFNWVMKKKE